MVQSPNGGIHAINPKTKHTYCGKNMLKLWNLWRPRDELPDEKHQPTCQICKRHYDDPINESLEGLKKDLLEQISEYLWLIVLLKDVDGLGRFTETIAKFLREEVKRGKKIVRGEANRKPT